MHYGPGWAGKKNPGSFGSVECACAPLFYFLYANVVHGHVLLQTSDHVKSDKGRVGSFTMAYIRSMSNVRSDQVGPYLSGRVF